VFEAAELNRKISREVYDEEVPHLRAELLRVQRELAKRADFKVIVLIAGVDKAGKGETMNLLNEWMDPRFLENNAFGRPTDEERERPYFWRFWRTLPPKGKIGIYCGSSWYSQPVLDRVYGRISGEALEASLVRIRNFEEELVRGGVLILKFWLHLNKQAQKRRLRRLERDPETRWRVTQRDKKNLKRYDRFCVAAEHALRATGTSGAPWRIVEGKDERYRSLTCGRALLAAIDGRLAEAAAAPAAEPSTAVVTETPVEAGLPTILSTVDLTQRLEKKPYKRRLEALQGKLNRLGRTAYRRGVSTVIVMEGWDAGGKGGIIRRLTPAIDARHYRVIPIAAPTDEERAHHYLWRFWRHLPRAGHTAIFDRSWYGRVLVERVERFATDAEWQRAYGEINDFEEQLAAHGMVVVKFWLHIDKDEQLARFKLREETPYKRYKITEEDYRNRERWDDYEVAVNEMVEKTSTAHAPWHLIAGNDKRFARVQAIETLCDALAARLGK